ncbi:ATP-grasp domain-containing protein [Gracilibacillus alcaliphilus]|uniref:ATP-grasp domain-containing protein n=1 Tax=Gracilibacillus alcaliphilus TaxID=1401441 RepID=UPI001956D0D9|nr:ATP-grasp domain-containing protein [Gracilibacillus alcaliphilus]MBM7677410.1 putative ATP-grasp superfamily ATP-dependent carboligase [Gracilibacillus alcaliphilus]
MSTKASCRILLTGGRAPVALELARHLSAAGHYIVIAESCSAPLSGVSHAVAAVYRIPAPRLATAAFVEELIDVIKREQIDIVIPTCEEIFYIAAAAEQLQPHCQLFMDDYDKLIALHNKGRFVEMSQDCHLAVPETFVLNSRQDWEDMISQPGKWVLKPVYSRFSTNVQIINVQTDGIIYEAETNTPLAAKKLLERYLTTPGSWIAQSYIEGQAYCSYSIVQHGQIAAHAVYPVEFTAGSGSCISFRMVERPDITAWIQQFVTSYQLHGQVAFDFIVEARTGQVYAIECNPRATSGVHLFQPMDRLAAAFFPGTVSIEPRSDACAMIAMAMWSFGITSLRSWRDVHKWWRFIWQGRDVVFRWRDPFPFLQQIRYLWFVYHLSKQQQISLMEATTFDIEWNGDSR